MESFVSALQRFGIGRLAAIIGVAAGVAAALFALVLNAGVEPQGLLYSNLDLKEAGSITQALDQAGIKYDVKGDGSTIMVPRDKVASTRLLLSGKGLPTSGSVGYEIFDQTSPLGQTDFVQNLNRQRALEGELARTIRSLQGVSSARVHLVLPKRQLFEDEAESPSASVVIGIAGREPSADEVRAVRNLIAGAVPDLKPEKVTVVDDRGKLLAGADDADNADQAADSARTQTEDRIRKTVKDLVEGVVGPGHARVQVTADLNLSSVTIQDEKYDPDGQVVRSTQTVEENSKQADASKNGDGSAANNIPNGANTGPSGDSSTDTTGHTEETTNYEISKTTRTEVQQPGDVKRLSVAVAVDGQTTYDSKGKPTYTPRSSEEMQRIDQLVRSAVGFTATRGDQVSVVNVRFDHEDDGLGASGGSPLSNFDKNDLMRGAELLVLLIMAGLVVFFVVRPLLSTAAGGGGPMPMRLAGGGAGNPALAGGAVGAAGGGENLALAAPGDVEQRIDIARIEGQVKASSVKRVAEFVDNHPDESVSILRTWLHESA
ncbi:MAG TPA: flagellar basal-body MS-ring/collar protein FliF [Caulobacteraceae bacterium]|nr:flagellar basal-body MS-ring/collar protein FliF [Caulobacteraceae bacterium]